MRRHRRHRAIQVARGAHVVAHHVGEEDRRLEHELRDDPRLEGSQLSIRGEAFEREGELGDAVVALGRFVQLVPGFFRKLVSRESQEERVENFGFVFETLIERVDHRSDTCSTPSSRFAHSRTDEGINPTSRRD